MSEYREKLQSLLRELFQFDSADLDFGIYAVMNHKRDQVERFIKQDLLDAIAEGLKLQSEAQQAKARADFAQARQKLQAEYGEEAFDAQGNLTNTVLAMPGQTAKRLREAYLSAQQALAASQLSNDLEGQVCNDLFRFFSRYYDEGDFNSQRRYGGREKYVIPYQGEEVLLHWANRDQYYVKTGEYFSDYRFAVEPAIGFGGASVHFKLRQASVEQNNVKGEKRFFVLAGDNPAQWDPAGRVLLIGFEYRPLAADEQLRAGSRGQQDKLNAEAETAVLKAIPDALLREQVGKLRGEPGKERSLLAKHLARYSARNTRDYFIHKDLGGFLRRELDFFLKNEVLRLEDLDWDQPAVVQATANRIQTLQLIAGRIIDFLAQIEDFQKRLWEKRKFVVQSNWCVTLDRTPAALYGEIAANERQRGEWQSLYGVALGPDADLGQHPFLMVDTAFFDDHFKARLLASFDDLDAACDGLLVHGENYQALRLLTPRYRGQVKCIYIDPPYNTDAGPILYKNDYRSSSWLSLISDRIHVSKELLMDSGVLCVTIDDYEQAELHFLLEQEYGAENMAATVSIRSNPSGRPVPTGFSQAHEYAIFVTKTSDAMLAKLPRTEDQAARYRHEDEDGSFMWELFRKRGSNSERKDRPSLYYPLFVSGERVRAPKMRWDEEKRVWEILEGPMLGEGVVYPIDDNGVERTWRGQPSNVAERPENYRAKSEDGIVTVYYKFRPRSEGVLPLTFWMDAKYSATEHGTGFLKHYFAQYDVFSYPKSIYAVEDTLRISGLVEEPGVALDFFAGSGTTGHAVINLNRQDGARRRYVLVEVGDHFGSVLKPRVQKAVYARDWRDGRPVSGSPGQSHMFQYIRLESYEDSLNNLRLRPLGDAAQAALYALPDYFLRYMLDFETSGSPSLLDTAQFERPFQYQLNITQNQETRPRTVDLVTTFNFLLGLRVRTVRRFERPLQNSDFSEKSEFSRVLRVVRVLGEDGAGRRVCVLWRDAPPLTDMEAEKQWLQAHVLADVAYDLLYINGESALPDALPIEGEFQRLMFEGAA